MKKILICTRKNKGGDEMALEQGAAAIYTERGGDQVKVVRDEELPWRDLKAIHGTFGEAARAVGRKYHVVVLVEVEASPGDRTIGKGQYAIASAAFEAKRVVAVARPGNGPHGVVLSQVKQLRIVDPNDWKTTHAEVVL
jgi:hypothetical protein